MYNVLTATQSLLTGDTLTSTGRGYQLVMQTDGNLVLYRLSDSKALWASNTQGSGAVQAIMQTDGNFVVYTAAMKAVWASGTNGSAATFLIMQDDGNLVLYPADNPIWATNTEQ